MTKLEGGLFPRGRAIEIVVLAVEVLLSEQTDEFESSVVHSLRLPEVRTGHLREVDVAVATVANGRVFRRIVEVRDRHRRVDSPSVDAVLGKIQALGVHRASIVSTAGFTEPALAKVGDERSRLDAIHLRMSTQEEMPVDWQDLRVAFPTSDPETVHQQATARSIAVDTESIQGVAFFPLRGLVYEDAIAQKPLLIILYGDVVLESCRGLMTFALPLAAHLRPGFKPVVVPRFLLESGAFAGEFAISAKGKTDNYGFDVGIPSPDVWKAVRSSYPREDEPGSVES